VTGSTPTGADLRGLDNYFRSKINENGEFPQFKKNKGSDEGKPDCMRAHYIVSVSSVYLVQFLILALKCAPCFRFPFLVHECSVPLSLFIHAMRWMETGVWPLEVILCNRKSYTIYCKH
jgi:hypothetical protein